MCDNIPHALSLTLHRFIVLTNERLDNFAFHTPNCVLTEGNTWRCTHYGIDYTSNIFVASKLPYYALVSMSFSKGKTEEEYVKEYKQLFGPETEIRDFTLINWVEKFYTTCSNINLIKLENVLNSDNGDIFVERVKKRGRKKGKKPGKIPGYSVNGYKSDDSDIEHDPPRVEIGNDDGTDPRINMDQENFSALSLYPYPKETNCVIEIFSTGNLNMAGIPSKEYFEKKMVPYVNEKLIHLLEQCCTECGDIDRDEIINEFIF